MAIFLATAGTGLPRALNASLVVFVQIRLNHTSQENFEEFRTAVMDLENIQSCFLVSGNYDYLIKARVADMAAYRELLGHRILKLPAVQESTSYVVMEELKETMEVPVPYSQKITYKNNEYTQPEG